jgi:HAD superfamily hydrolase (TIGR01490 family)
MSNALPTIPVGRAPTRVAVFDVDGTLLDGDCLLLAARRSRPPIALLAAAVALVPALCAWKLGRLSTGQFKERTLRRFAICARVNQAEAAGQPQWLLGDLERRLRPQALQRLRWHQGRGDRVLLCSASPRMLLQPLADRLGVELLATELQRQQGRWQPLLAGANCKGAEKVVRLQSHLGSLEGLSIEAYGDSRGDRELLQLAARPHFRSFGPGPQPYPAFSLAPLLPVAALALLAYGLVGMRSQGAELLALLPTLGPRILLGLGLVLLGYALRFGRWRLLLTSLELRPPLTQDARIWMGSYAFTATPGKGGEAVRSLLLRDECHMPVPATLMALVVERFTDGTAVLLLLLLNLRLLFGWDLPVAVPLALVLLLALVAWGGLRWGRRGTGGWHLPERLLPLRLRNLGQEGFSALRRLLRPQVLLPATVIGAVAWSLEGISLWLLLQGLGSTQPSWAGATLAHTAAGLLGALTLLPGGLGSTEAGTVGLLSLQGVPLATAVPATLLIRLMTLWFATALGMVCLLLPRARAAAEEPDSQPPTEPFERNSRP